MDHFLNPSTLFIADLLVFTTIVLMNIAQKSIITVYLYSAQSLIITLLMILGALNNHSMSLAVVAGLILVIKVIGVPTLMSKQIKKQTLGSSTSNYLNLPLTIAVIAIITTISHSRYFQPLLELAPENENALLISIAAMFISLFLIINRKGALAQMIGVLSLENAIVSFVFAAGLEQGPGLQLGIVSDIFLWAIIATVFLTMIQKKFDTLDVSVMTKLKG